MDGNNMNNDAINPVISERKTQNFNLIVGIATLLIALFGATFAYFTATARSNEGEVTVKSAMLSINFERGAEIKAQNLIPSTQKIALAKYQKGTDVFTPTEEEGYVMDYDEYIEQGNGNDLTPYLDRKCIDANGREVCYVFRFSVTSDGQEGESTNVISYITVDENEFQNLSYLLYEVKYRRDDNDNILRDKYGFGVIDDTNGDGYHLIESYPIDENAPIVEEYGYAKFKEIESVINEEGEAGVRNPIACLFGEKDPDEEIAVPDNNTPLHVSDLASNDTRRCKVNSISNGVRHDYQIVIWLEETNKEQLEQGKRFSGTIVIENSVDASSDGVGGQITGKN